MPTQGYPNSTPACVDDLLYLATPTYSLMILISTL